MSHVFWLAFYLPILIAAPIQHSLAVAAAGTAPVHVRSRRHLLLNYASLIGAVVVFPTALIWHEWGFLVAVPMGFATALRNMTYANRRTATVEEWRRESLIGMVTAGVAIMLAAWLVWR